MSGHTEQGTQHMPPCMVCVCGVCVVCVMSAVCVLSMYIYKHIGSETGKFLYHKRNLFSPFSRTTYVCVYLCVWVHSSVCVRVEVWKQFGVLASIHPHFTSGDRFSQ